MHLFIIRSGSQYIRIKESKLLPCSLDKASVFPLNQLRKCKTYCMQLLNKGIKNAEIRILEITEKPFNESILRDTE